MPPRPGRPRRNAPGSREAGARLADQIRRRNLTQATLASHVGVGPRTVGRWVRGEAGPNPEQASRLADFLDNPQVLTWWRLDPDRTADEAEPDPPGANEPTGARDSETRDDHDDDRSRRKKLLIAGAVVTATAVALFLVVVGASERSSQPAGTARPGPVPPVVGTGSDARLTAPLNGAMTVGHPDAKTISLWSLPSTSSGCDISPCQPGADEIGSVTVPADVKVICVKVGQQIRNGAPGDPGFYRDDRWLKVDPIQNFGQSSKDQVLWLSNVWYLRELLPEQLPRC